MSSKLPILYVSYNGLGEPLVHSQVLPYLRGLSKAGYPISLLTYERRGTIPNYLEQQKRAILQLTDSGIPWYSLKYHKSPSLLATSFDILCGFVYMASLILRSGVKAIHARSYVPAVIGYLAKRIFRIKFIFDMRGMMADEYVDAGNWKREGLHYRLAKSFEKWLLREADEIIVLTERIKEHLLNRPDLNNGVIHNITVIPCCYDDNRFCIGESPDAALAQRLNLAGSNVLVYAGSVGTWYLLDEMLDFFRTGLGLRPDLRFLILNQNEQTMIHRAIQDRGFERHQVTVVGVRPEEVSKYLSLATVGLFFIKSTFSKSASSPTKFAEYLSMGLPVVVNAGVGDVDKIVREFGVGVVVEDLSPEAYARGWRLLWKLLEDRYVSERCRRVAEEHFSLQVGLARFNAVYSRLAEVI